MGGLFQPHGTWAVVAMRAIAKVGWNVLLTERGREQFPAVLELRPWIPRRYRGPTAGWRGLTPARGETFSNASQTFGD